MNCLFARKLATVAGFLALSVLSLPAQVTLVPTGSDWRYFDLGSEPAGWRNPFFDDSSWSNGVAQLGFGNDGEVTRLARTNAAGTTNIAFYFRHTFNVPDPSMLSNLLVRLRRDDGAIVHLNGEEIFRSNMPPGPANDSTFAVTIAADDGNTYYAVPAFISLLVPGANVLAVQVHQANQGSSDISFDLELLANTLFQAPSVSLVAPLHTDIVGAPHVYLVAKAADIDGVAAAVEFYEGANWIGTVITPGNVGYSLTWSNAPLGVHTLRAVSVDNTGLSSTSAPVTVEVVPALIPRGAVWKFLDDGSDQSATGWATPAFDDSGWSNGAAQLGYGEGDEVTLINDGPDANRFITTYFRHRFNVADPGAYSNLILRVLRDDGALAYLNGVEIFRNNLPPGAIGHLTESSDTIDEAVFFHAAPVSLSLLVPGPNLLAIELHQSGPTSSDVSFDLELLPNVAPRPPNVAILSPTNNTTLQGPLTISATISTWDVNEAVATVALYDGGTLLASDTVDPEAGESGVTLGALLNPGPHTLCAVATDAGGLSSTSAPVTLQIIPAPVLTTLVATGSVWRFLDVNTNLGAAWRAADYDDSSWGSGVGILGYGTLGQASALPATAIYGGPSNNRYITAYFRHRFTAANVAAVTNLAFRVVRDDGVVAYLNNAEVFRMNMPPGAIVSSTRATNNVAGTNELFYAPTNVTAMGLLLDGENILAVELHQDMPTTSDGAFDLSLVAISTPTPPPPSPVIAYNPPDIAITWPGEGFILQRAPAPQGPFADILPARSPYTVPQTNAAGFFRLKKEP